MGITQSDVLLLEKALEIQPDIKTVLSLGSQNLYLHDSDPVNPPFARYWFEMRGMKYTSIDLAGDDNSLVLDLSKPIEHLGKFDLLTDHGTSEHLVQNIPMESVSFHEGHIHSVYPSRIPKQHEIEWGFYNCWANKHRLLNEGGIMINVNPKTGNWPDHGYTYINTEFYYRLAMLMGYEIIHIAEDAAMGNPNAVNIQCIIRKNDLEEFVSFQEFQTCPQFKS